MTGDGRAGELRVLIVTDQYEPMVGGVPTVTRELARGLAERGHAVQVLAPSTTGRSATAGSVAGGGCCGRYNLSAIRDGEADFFSRIGRNPLKSPNWKK